MSQLPTSPAAALNPPAPRARRRPLSRRKRWLFRMVAVALSLLLLAGMEGVLRLAGFGRDLRLVVPVDGHPQALPFQLNPLVDLAYYGTTDVSGPEVRRFMLPKPPRVFRIVFLGESTVIGFPYSSEISFPRQVEVLLERQQPKIDFEVLNVGITSMNSFALADLARQCLACDPDLVVVHAGHNEFYGPGGPASNAMQLPPRWLPLAYTIRRWRLSQLLTGLIPSGARVQEDLMDLLPGTLEIPLDGPVFQQAETNYQHNLQRIVDVCHRADVPVLLSTVACNLRQQSPMRTVWPPGISAAQRQSTENGIAVAESLLLQGEYTQALETLAKVEDTCPGNARAVYRQAQCLEGLGRAAEALAAYQRARDLDGCRFRAPSSFAPIVKRLAEQNSTRGCQFLDIAALVQQRSLPAGPGNDLFLEHVHYNFAGHRLLGELFARGIMQQVLRADWNPALVPDKESLNTQLGVLPEDELAADSLALFVVQTKMQQTAPDAGRQQQHISRLLAEHYRELSPERRQVFEELAMPEFDAELISRLALRHLAAGNTELAGEFARAGIVRRPYSAEAWLLLGEIQLRAGKREPALESLHQARTLRPDYAEAVETLLQGDLGTTGSR